ncbi:MAG TPA: type II secretion system F family protein [Pirellulales bacterium]|jgi:tight adherence protein B|nr:type II secretion system F family protein [Pirellulales bacterium]
MKPEWIAPLTFISVVLFVGALLATIYDTFVRYHLLLNNRMDELSGRLKPGSLDTLFQNIKPLDATGNSWREQLADYLEQAGLRIHPNRFMVACLGLGVFVALVLGAAMHRWWIGALAFVPCSLLPLAYVRFRHAARAQRMLLQLPQAFDVVGRAVRAGQTIPAAFQIVAQELDAPLADEFLFCYEQQNLGMPYDIALRGLAQRTGIIELRILAVALLVQSRTGGNLVELVTNLSKMVTKRIKMQQRVKTLTSESRMQATVLMVLPAVAFAGLLVLSPEYGSTLLDYPRLLGGTVAAQCAGAVWIRRCVSLDF